MNPEKYEMHPGLERIARSLCDWVGERILLTGQVTAAGILIKLRTEDVLEGIMPNDFVNPEINIKFSDGKEFLSYKERPIIVSDFYRACNDVRGEIVRKEEQSHLIQLLGFAELSIDRTLRGSITPANFREVYAMCRNYFAYFPRLDSGKSLKEVKENLVREKEKLQSGNSISITGLDFFSSMCWSDAGVSTCVFDRCKTYQTGSPLSMQFREDLERYAKLAR